jgi:DNA-binding response OmpR family regulator
VGKPLKRILIIEDEMSIAELERDYLEIDGFRVDIENRGDTGLQRALQEPYDLILLDVMLPVVDGFEICRKIRSVQDTPILMVSAKKEDIDKIRGLGLGADDYIIKPFSPGELVARVKAHLNRYERLMGNRVNTNEEIRIRGLTIDKTSRRVYVNEKEVVFTTKEFDLLAFLAVHPNRVFSKDHLFEQVWGFDSMGDIATVTVHIRKVREKVELDPSNPQYIETVWGAGYRFKL